MRIWSLHPKYLDPRGLVALWREGLLAQAVLMGKTRGYTHHPQLRRFREQPDPGGSIAQYLLIVHQEAVRRGYRFLAEKINPARASRQLLVTEDQLVFECNHLREKLQRRDPAWLARWDLTRRPRAHPLFRVVPGPVADWERGFTPPGHFAILKMIEPIVNQD